VEFLILEVEGTRFGIRPGEVREVVRAVTIAELPGAAPVYEGVINLRGEVVPVVDSRVLLGLPTRALRHHDHLVIVQTGEQVLALRVDRALDLAAFSPTEAELSDASGYGMKCVSEIARTPEGLLQVLSPSKFLSDAEWASLASLLSNSTSAEKDG
jgi:purine-binding chemotaxis protein CheW